MEPNTTIALDDLTDQHLREIGELYRATGLPCDSYFLRDSFSVKGIRAAIKKDQRIELRPVIARDIGKMYFEEKRSKTDGKKYVNILAGVNSNHGEIKKIDHKTALRNFDQSLRDRFYRI